MSILAYRNFDAYVSKDGSEKPTLRNIMRRYTKIEDDEVKSALITQKETWIFARRVAKTRRFGSLHLVYYESVLADALHMQFAAITFLLPNRTAYVAFRGTDHSIVGWSEDFRMSF